MPMAYLDCMKPRRDNEIRLKHTENKGSGCIVLTALLFQNSCYLGGANSKGGAVVLWLAGCFFYLPSCCFLRQETLLYIVSLNPGV